MISDNPAYQPYTVAAEDIVEVWQAQMIISRANQQQRWDVNQIAIPGDQPAAAGERAEKENELSLVMIADRGPVLRGFYRKNTAVNA
jgi:hypothetical protein